MLYACLGISLFINLLVLLAMRNSARLVLDTRYATVAEMAIALEGMELAEVVVPLEALVLAQRSGHTKKYKDQVAARVKEYHQIVGIINTTKDV